MTYKKLESLGQLLGCYFHQDWTDEFSNEASALQSIIESESEEQLAAGVDEINGLLAAALSEDDLAVILTGQVGCYFDPGSEGITYGQWLERVRERFTMP